MKRFEHTPSCRTIPSAASGAPPHGRAHPQDAGRRAGTRAAFGMGAAVCATLGLAACATGRTVVEEPAHKETFQAAQLVEEPANVQVPAEVASGFKSALAEKLYGQNHFVPGNGLVVKYQFVQYTGGNRFERWFFGGIGNAGEASTMVKVNFLDPSGAQLGTIQVEGRIGSGFFGGSSDDALDKATDQIVAYAVSNFR